jgi:hypothetical protein
MPGSGSAILNFGAFPGSVETTVDVTGQAGLTSASKVEAWVLPVATADHTVDEHRIERIRVIAQYKVDGELTIYGYDNATPAWREVNYITGRNGGAQSQRVYGQFTVGWAWA